MLTVIRSFELQTKLKLNTHVYKMKIYYTVKKKSFQEPPISLMNNTREDKPTAKTFHLRKI